MIFKILKNISGNNQAKGEKDEGVRDESKTMRRALFQALGIQPRTKQSPCSCEHVVYQMAVSAKKKNKRVRKTGVGNLSKTVILYRVVFKATRLDKVTQGAKVGREKKRSGN